MFYVDLMQAFKQYYSYASNVIGCNVDITDERDLLIMPLSLAHVS
jgi:hypothetical protein